jgi:DNA-directed RNA polymerase specialized sigma24 family protein
VPDPAARELVPQRRRRLYTYLRSLLPGTDVEGALVDTERRITRRDAPTARLVEWADGIAREVAAERRKTISPLPFSDDLFRQLADSAGPILDQSEKRPAALKEILRQLPPPERLLLRRKYELGMLCDQIAVADGRPVAVISRDLAALHESLVAALREAVPDAGPEPPGGAADIGRLSDQLLGGTITDDGRLVLETLLLADAAAQVHYHRHGALAAELKWHYAGPPSLPESPPAPPARTGLTPREQIVTAAFLVAILAVITFAVVRFAS